MKSFSSFRLLLVALPLLAVLCFASCLRHSAAWPLLQEAEALMETDYKAAGALLDSLDATPLQGEDAALYAILKTQADYKRYVPLTSDSLPRVATAYYGTPYRKNYHAAMAWYALGCYYTEHHADAAAIDVYLKAKDLFPDTLSRYHALCYQNIGKHLYLHDMPKDAIPYLTTFHEHPVCKTDSCLISNADYCLGVAYLRNKDFDKAEQSFYAVLNNRYSSNSDALDAVFQLSKLLYHNHDNYGASLALIDKYIKECQSLYQVGALWSMKGDVYYQFHELDSALYYYKRALQETNDIYTRCDVYKQLLNLAPLVNETDSMPFYTSQYTSLLSKIYEEDREAELIEAKSKHEVELLYYRRNTLFCIIGVTILVVVLALLIIYKIKNRRKVYHASSAVNVEMNLPLVSKQELIEQCKDSFSRTSAAKLIPSDLQFEKNLTSPEKVELEKALNESFAKVMASLCHECDNMTPDDALTCIYIILGLTSKNIEACSKFTGNSIASRKTRLRSKLSSEWRLLIFGPNGKSD